MRETYQNIDLTIEDILGLLKVVVCRSCRTSFNFVESRGKMCWGLSLGANRVEIRCGCVLALRQRNELVAGALDDSKRNEVVRHYKRNQFSKLKRHFSEVLDLNARNYRNKQ